ncbi:MAG: cation:proton antiporter [Oscillospiraceae bacterium]|nr:cation:proton antiporter [Oscillospiraceae bacterium]
MEYGFLFDIALILVSTKLLGLITRKFQMPQVVGALLAGLLLGPAMLGLLQPSTFLSNIAEMGVIVLMFSAGMDTNLQDLKKTGKAGMIVALCGVLVPLVLGAVLMIFFNRGEFSYPGSKLLQNIFMGTILTATSVSITVETLKEIGKLSTKTGNTILAAALIDDILGLICLTVVTSMAGAEVNIGIVLLKILLFFVFVAVVAFLFMKLMGWYEHKVMHDQNLRRLPILAFVLCLAMAFLAEEVFGVADIIGAFAAGLIVSNTPKGSYIASKFSPLSYLLLSPVFFANIGLKVELPKMDGFIILFSVMLVLVAVGSKLVGCGLGARFCGFTKLRQCIQVGCGMACRGEVALIVANKGTALGMLNPVFFGPIIIMVVCCAVFTPIMLKLAFKGDAAYEGLQQSDLVDSLQRHEQLDVVAQQIIEAEENRKKGS